MNSSEIVAKVGGGMGDNGPFSKLLQLDGVLAADSLLLDSKSML